MPIPENTRLGRYEIRSQLGSGGMGDVYLAVDSLLGRNVAIKVFPSEFGKEADRLARFVREAKAASALNHPGILTVFDVGKKSGMYFIVTELVEGVTLREWVNRDSPTLTALLEAIRQAALALDVAHRAGIVHRDIKPENLMRREDGLIKVLDFGIAKMIPNGNGSGSAESEIPLTAAGALVGTVRYMSPEQASGHSLDGRTDIWSLGVVLYELATGRAPFGKASVIATVVDITTKEPAAISEHLPDALVEFDEFILRALRKDPNERFQTAAEMAEALTFTIDVLKERNPSVATVLGEARQAGIRTVTQPAASDRTGRETAASTTNLRRRRHKLIGRERELSEMIAHFRSDVSERALSITGPGGTGKTRLAVEVGYQLQLSADFPNGVFLADLSPLSEATMIAPAIARAIGLKPPFDNESGLHRELAPKQTLLVLDNFEHLLEGSTTVSELLEAAPGLRVLVTSRAPLRLSEEREYPLEPLEVPLALTLPPIDELAQIPAVALFVERARQSNSAFSLNEENARAIVEVCRKLEGLPLALELAAARVKLLAPSAMLERLDHQLRLLTGGARDLPGRQQTMRGAIAWSYNLLNDEERAVFRRLSVFSGGCTLKAAETVCGLAGESVLDAMGALIDNSLVKQREQDDGQNRFSMLEVVREFAHELLEKSGEAEDVRLAYARFFKKVVENADQYIRSGNQVVAVRRLSRERENVKSAVAILLRAAPQEGAAFVGSVQSYWSAQGYSAQDRRSWLMKALQAENLKPALQARLLNGVTRCEIQLGKLDDAVDHGRAALEAARSSGDDGILGIALGGYGQALSVVSNLDAARIAFLESVELARKRGNAHSLSVALGSLGEVVRISGDLDAAIHYYEEALEAAGQDSRSNPTGIVFSNLGGVSLEKGDMESAAKYYRRSLEIFAELENTLWTSTALDGLAAVELYSGDPARAAMLAGAAQAISASLEDWEQSLRERYTKELKDKLDPYTFKRQWTRGQAMTFQEATSEALVL